MTGCGCVLLIAALVGLILFLVFGSTDPGEPIENAVALVRPSKAVRDVDAGAVRKKMKDKAFARAVSREMMLKGAEDMAIPFEELTSEVIAALSDAADRLGLAGTAS